MTRFPVGLIVTLLSSAVAAPLWAQGNYTAASCNYSDVNAVINGPTHIAVDGDVINIPAGTCTWSTGIIVPSGIGITIQGYGTPNSTPAAFGASASCSTGTVLNLTGANPAFLATVNYGNSTMRFSCMALNYSSGANTALLVRGRCTSSGCPNLRVDNTSYSGWANHRAAGIAYGISAVDDMFGVYDHNTVVGPGTGITFVELNHATYLGVGYNGDNSWAQSEAYGSNHFMFFENNVLDSIGAFTDDEANAEDLAHEGGTREVIRYNQYNNMGGIAMGWHGTESNGRPRSGRVFEFYGNTYTCKSGNSCDSVSGWRGGTGLVWGNTTNWTGASLNSFFTATLYRAQGAINWGACDGSSPYDTNDGVTYITGTITGTSGSAPAITLTINQTGGSPSQPWTANYWSPYGAPYSLHDVTQTTGGEITNSGSNTLVVNSGPGGPGSWTPRVGDSIQILRASACIDQPGGRGTGFLYTGNSGNGGSPVQSTAEVLSPTYGWMNTFNPAKDFGALGPVLSSGGWTGSGRIIRNREIYTEDGNQAQQSSTTSPFDGSTGGTAGKGIGHGTLANRPTTCTPNPVAGALGGVGYWASDSGPAWDNGSQGGQLFVCTATNTWTLYYTPFTYPHPLIQGTGRPAPPLNLTAIPN